MSLSEALIGLKAYKEVDQRMALFWHSIDDAVVKPRTAVQTTSLPSISVDTVGSPPPIPESLLTSTVDFTIEWPGRPWCICTLYRSGKDHKLFVTKASRRTGSVTFQCDDARPHSSHQICLA